MRVKQKNRQRGKTEQHRKEEAKKEEKEGEICCGQ
jgi:hypothetical protein